jgi:hypothetical protein
LPKKQPERESEYNTVASKAAEHLGSRVSSKHQYELQDGASGNSGKNRGSFQKNSKMMLAVSSKNQQTYATN